MEEEFKVGICFTFITQFWSPGNHLSPILPAVDGTSCCLQLLFRVKAGNAIYAALAEKSKVSDCHW